MDTENKKNQEIDDEEAEFRRQRRIAALRDRDRRTNSKSGCSVQALIALAAVVSIIVIIL